VSGPQVPTELRGLPLAHLEYLTDGNGLFEHAREGEPRLEHGYCLDDAARALEFTVREWELSPSERIASLAHTYLAFVESAIAANGAAHNRMDPSGNWTDLPAGGDWWGRAVHALGIAAAVVPELTVRERASVAFRRASLWVTGDLRAHLYASVGAAEVLAANAPELGDAAQQILARQWPNMSIDVDATAVTGAGHDHDSDPAWPWPEPRLRYANGIIPEALIAVGAATARPALVKRGLHLLDFLLELQTSRGHLSLVGQDGWGPGDLRPQFDQQPIEAACLASACARAFRNTGSVRYLEGVSYACHWFLGDNDAHTLMVDLDTGAGYDGLTATGRNLNRGAESTLAALTTFQSARRCGLELEAL
jgi:hypothetical protein